MHAMIQVQIAASVQEDGVADLRWVLLDPSEAAAPVRHAALVQAAVPRDGGVSGPIRGQSPAQPDPRPLPAADSSARWTYWVLRAALLIAALVGAMWTSSSLLDLRGAAVGHSSTRTGAAT